MNNETEYSMKSTGTHRRTMNDVFSVRKEYKQMAGIRSISAETWNEVNGIVPESLMGEIEIKHLLNKIK